MPKLNQKCWRCGALTGLLIRYHGWMVGWFCEEHRPDKGSEVQVNKILQNYAPVKGKPGDDMLPVIPLELSDKRHPFSQAANEMIKKGEARWEMQRGLLTPLTPLSLNRQQRRAEKKQK